MSMVIHVTGDSPKQSAHGRSARNQQFHERGLHRARRMGTGMAANLLKVCQRVTVYNRTPARAEPLTI